MFKSYNLQSNLNMMEIYDNDSKKRIQWSYHGRKTAQKSQIMTINVGEEKKRKAEEWGESERDRERDLFPSQKKKLCKATEMRFFFYRAALDTEKNSIVWGSCYIK